MPARLHYFAYGSNMLVARMVERVGNVGVVGRATLRGYRLAFHKRGADGSAKCDVVAVTDDSALVHGIVFTLESRQSTALDRFEGPGYAAGEVSLALENEPGPVTALTYLARAQHVQPGLLPYSWYKSIVIAGARRHGLPAAYIAKIEAVESIDDPDPQRAARNLAALGQA